MAATGAYDDISKEPRSQSESRGEETHSSTCSPRRSKNRYAKREHAPIKRPSHTLKSSKEKYDLQSESKSDDQGLLTKKLQGRPRSALDSGMESGSSADLHKKAEAIAREMY